MKISAQRFDSGRQRIAAFTMVEIAIALGVIAFALVAIIGVLPMGLNVQRENREDTIINQDGPYLLEAIRSGTRNLDHLTNQFDRIDVVYVNTNSTSNWSFVTNVQVYPLTQTNGNQIVGLLSIPKWSTIGAPPGYQVYRVEARVRAMSGSALENANRDLAFNYLMTSEVVPFHSPAPTMVNVNSNDLAANLYDVRLTFRWPVFPNGNVGKGGRKVFRGAASGTMEEGPLCFLRPQQYENKP